MKTVSKIIAIICLVCTLFALPIVSYCDTEPLRGIPEYTGVCPYCGSTSWTLIQQRVKETRSWMRTCPNSDTGAVHKHFILSYYNDYSCNVCATITSRFDHSSGELCSISYYSLDFTE